MKNFIFVLALFAFTGCATARTDALVSAGIGKDVLAKQPFERMGSLGVQYGDAWKVRANGGCWLATAPGQNSSGFGSLQGGLEVVGEGGTFAGLLFGPSFITRPDAKLSGRFQFHLSGGVGVKNRAGYGVGLKWEHFSNAGLILPNYGRDLWTAFLVIPISTFWKHESSI